MGLGGAGRLGPPAQRIGPVASVRQLYPQPMLRRCQRPIGQPASLVTVPIRAFKVNAREFGPAPMQDAFGVPEGLRESGSQRAPRPQNGLSKIAQKTPREEAPTDAQGPTDNRLEFSSTRRQPSSQGTQPANLTLVGGLTGK